MTVVLGRLYQSLLYTMELFDSCY